MGKSTINGTFSIAMLVYQRVYTYLKIHCFYSLLTIVIWGLYLSQTQQKMLFGSHCIPLYPHCVPSLVGKYSHVSYCSFLKSTQHIHKISHNSKETTVSPSPKTNPWHPQTYQYALLEKKQKYRLVVHSSDIFSHSMSQFVWIFQQMVTTNGPLWKINENPLHISCFFIVCHIFS
jgi:hypothetical protein